MSKRKRTFANNYTRYCVICNEEFKTSFSRQNTCGFACAQERQRRNNRGKQQNTNKPKKACIICGYNITTDTHHDGTKPHKGVDTRKTYILCPNHHALITRGIATLDELMNIPNKFY